MLYFRKFFNAVGIKSISIKLVNLFLRLLGLNVLSVKETLVFSKKFQISVSPSETHYLPELHDAFSSEKIIFNLRKLNIPASYLWDFSDENAYLSKYGSVIIENKVLCTHWTHDGFYKGLWQKDNRKKLFFDVLIAPFSHFQDEKVYSGYYDYVFFVATKLAKIRKFLGNEDFERLAISYASFGGKYEIEYLELLGLPTERFYDSQEYKVSSTRVLTANMESWHPSKAAILTLKEQVGKNFSPKKTESNRLYISRAGRRKIINESELIALLKEFDFKIIEDTGRSVAEQITIYKNASFIIGAHGASFTNIIWSEPGTHLFELFSPNYVPDFFLYLAGVMEINYSAYYYGTQDISVSYADGLTEDIFVSVPELRKCLEGFFEN